MTWLSFIATVFWGCVVYGCVRLVTGAVERKRFERDLAQLRAEFNAQRLHERLAELESGQTGLRNRLESLKTVVPLGSKWGR